MILLLLMVRLLLHLSSQCFDIVGLLCRAILLLVGMLAQLLNYCLQNHHLHET